MRIHAPLIEAQIVEGLVLNYVNFQSLIATKTSRIWLASKKAPLMEFGLRRAQGVDGAFSATRASFIGGASSTSNTLAAKAFGIPVAGTMAHSWIMSHSSELKAFREYAEIYPENCIFLIDTYDTLKSGIKNAIQVARENNLKKWGVRLDSGDISYLSREVRKQLDKAGFSGALIAASNELTEEIVSTLTAEGAPVDLWGVGTNMVTGGTESSFTGVYKLCGRYDKASSLIQPVMKFSDNPEKNTNPGIKNVFRLFDEEGTACADVLTFENEAIQTGVEKRYFHTMVDYRHFSFAPAKAVQLLHCRVKAGKRIDKQTDIKDRLKLSRENMEKQLDCFDESYKRILNPHVYKVSLSENLAMLKKTFIEANMRT